MGINFTRRHPITRLVALALLVLCFIQPQTWIAPAGATITPPKQAPPIALGLNNAGSADFSGEKCRPAMIRSRFADGLRKHLRRNK